MTRLERRIEAAIRCLEDAVMFTYGKADYIKKSLENINAAGGNSRETRTQDVLNVARSRASIAIHIAMMRTALEGAAL